MNGIHINDDDDLAGEFRIYVKDGVAQMRAALAAETGPSLGAEACEEIYGLSHNIKGMGTSFHFDLMTDVCALLCRYLKAAMRNELTADADAVSAFVRALDVIIEHDIRGSGGDQGRALIGRLSVYTDQV